MTHDNAVIDWGTHGFDNDQVVCESAKDEMTVLSLSTDHVNMIVLHIHVQCQCVISYR